jgi:hypothetical protein
MPSKVMLLCFQTLYCSTLSFTRCSLELKVGHLPITRLDGGKRWKDGIAKLNNLPKRGIAGKDLENTLLMG